MSDVLRSAIGAALAPARPAARAPAGPPRRVMIATPTYDSTLHYRYVESLTAAWLYCVHNGVQVEMRIAAGFTLVQFARNYLSQLFLDDPTFTHILWLDSDLGFDPRGILRLVEHGKDVVGGVYPVKTMPSWFPFQATGHKSGELLEASVMPTGFLLVSRRAMEAVAESVPFYWHHHKGQRIRTRHIFDLELVERAGEPELIGEDVVLCHRLRTLGFDIWADPDIGFRHCGMYEWGGLLRREMRKWADEGLPGWADGAEFERPTTDPPADGKRSAAA